MKKAIIVGIGMGLLIGLFLILRGENRALPAPITRQEILPTNSPTPALSKPLTLRIARLNVNAQIEHVGLDKKGNMDVPQDADNVAWFQLGFKPGEHGNSVMAGHLDKVTGAPAVFYDVGKLNEGDEIEVIDDKGTILTFVVTGREVFPYNDFPLQEVFGPSNKKRLNLITCQGTFDKAARNYSHRTVIYSELQE